MPVTVIVTTPVSEVMPFQTWDTACGQAVRESLAGNLDVVIEDTNGLRYHVYAEPVEKDS